MQLERVAPYGAAMYGACLAGPPGGSVLGQVVLTGLYHGRKSGLKGLNITIRQINDL